MARLFDVLQRRGDSLQAMSIEEGPGTSTTYLSACTITTVLFMPIGRGAEVRITIFFITGERYLTCSRREAVFRLAGRSLRS